MKFCDNGSKMRRHVLQDKISHQEILTFYFKFLEMTCFLISFIIFFEYLHSRVETFPI